MIGRLIRFFRQPPSLRLQRLKFAWRGFVTRWWYRPRMIDCKGGSIIGTPLYWTPEAVKVGRNVLIWPGCRIEAIYALIPGNDKTPLIEIGDNVVMQQQCHITAGGYLQIGAGTLMSFNVSIQDTDHIYEDISCSVSHQPLALHHTRIGENCFIGARASIQAGTQLGRHCIVGANAVVRGHFPDYCVLAGAPARVIKRYDPISDTWQRVSSAEVSTGRPM